MVEMLVRVIDKTNPDFYLNLGCSKRGDVIAVKPSGWAWTPAELTSPDWRILKVPLAMAEAQKYLRPQDDGKDSRDPTKSKTLKRRDVGIDLDNILIPASVKTGISDSVRATPIIDVGAFNISSITVIKAIAVDVGPIVIGP